MASTALEKNAARIDDQVQRLQQELEALKKQYDARLAALEALVPRPGEAAAAPEPLTAETLAVIAAAVTAFLGKKVKIRSAHLLQTASPWAQAGRAIVQASHNLKR